MSEQKKITKRITPTADGLFVSLAPMPKPRPHSHKWFVDGERGTYCGTCGKPHPTEGRRA